MVRLEAQEKNPTVRTVIVLVIVQKFCRTLTLTENRTMAPLKVDEYEDFVLKLKIKAADGKCEIMG